MPFNASGFFQRLFNWRNDRDAGIKILAERMDQELDGFAAAINDIVEVNVDWKGPMTGVFGTAAAPAYSFQEDPDTGMYRASSNVLGFSIEGEKKAELNANGLTVSDKLTAGSLAVNGGAVFTADDADFVVSDSTDDVPDYIWRDHSASRLYLGAAESADVHFRSNVDFGAHEITSAIIQNRPAPLLGLYTPDTSNTQAQLTMQGARTNLNAIIAQIDYLNAGEDVEGLSARWQIAGNGNVNLSTGLLQVDGNKVWHAGNHGSDSTLDADLLDGQHGSFYRNATNLDAGTVAAARLSTATTQAIGNNSTKIATTAFVHEVVNNLNRAKIRKIHRLFSGTVYTRTSQTEGNMSDILHFTPVANNTRFLIMGNARVMVRSLAGENDARADLRLRYFHRADDTYYTLRNASVGVVGVTPSNSGASNYHYTTLSIFHDNNQDLVVYGNAGNEVYLRLLGEAAHANTEVNVYEWQLIVWEYEV